MKVWQIIALCVMFGFFAAGVLYIISTRPQGDAIRLIPVPTQSPYLVQVIGAINQPGVVAVPMGSRVQDAIDAAGGMRPDAEIQSLNLARILQDGERIYVPSIGEYVLTNATPPPARPDIPLPASLINLNTASQAELEQLPSIGPSKAQAILGYRQSQGAFTSIDELLDIPGIGPSLFAKIKDLVTIGEND
ncbi:MAG: helix-hairpin-helix domain-containing protein [Anaerolineaceae bacterium]|nr:helix-hairpin-helix domain-containing protein [Anaerolineaceae bacterium]